MKLSDLVSIFKKDLPGLIKHSTFTPPDYRCTRWVLVRGPAYADETFRGSLLVDASQLEGWAAHDAEAGWSTDEANQQARVFLPGWLSEADLDDESVTLLGKEMRGVVEQYAQNFVAFSNTRTYCPECNALSEVVIVNQNGRGTRTIVEDWSCPAGHRVNHEETRIMI